MNNLHSNKFPVSLAAILVAIAIVTALIAAAMPSTAEAQAPDLHGSCVFAWMPHHNPEYIEAPGCYVEPGVPAPVSEKAGGEVELVVEIEPVVETEEPVVVEDDEPIVIDDGGVDMGDDDTDVKTHTDNGNHYGNDKPDNNSKDVKNKHNGEQTAADHHDNNGKKK
jgi:hypothetical protein